MRYNFILRNEDNSPVEKRCRCMKVSRNAYYHWVRFKRTIILETPKMKLQKRIRIIFEKIGKNMAVLKFRKNWKEKV